VTHRRACLPKVRSGPFLGPVHSLSPTADMLALKMFRLLRSFLLHRHFVFGFLAKAIRTAPRKPQDLEISLLQLVTPLASPPPPKPRFT